MTNNWEYFTEDEFRCGRRRVNGKIVYCPHCGGESNIKYALVDVLDNIRRRIGRSMHVNSGCRCENHNAEVGGEDDSEHLDGYGSDIRAITSRMKYLLVKAALDEGITRIGIGEDFVHLGISPDKPQEVIWVY